MPNSLTVRSLVLLALGGCAADLPTGADPGPGAGVHARGHELSQSGSHTVVVPETIGRRALCLNGACTEIGLGGGGTLTLSYADELSTSEPRFLIESCPGGVTLLVRGLSVGATMEARFTTTLPPGGSWKLRDRVRESLPRQRAGVCDA